MINAIQKKMIDFVYHKIPETKYAIGAILSTLLMLGTGSIGGLLEVATEPLWLTMIIPIMLMTAVFIKMKPAKYKMAVYSSLSGLFVVFSLGLYYMFKIPGSYRFEIYLTWFLANVSVLGVLTYRLNKRKHQIIQSLQSAYLAEMISSKGLAPDQAAQLEQLTQTSIKLQNHLDQVLPKADRSPEEVEKILRELQQRAHSHRKPSSRKARATKHRP